MVDMMATSATTRLPTNHLTLPRREGVGSRRTVLRLDWDGRVHLSTVALDSGGPAKTTPPSVLPDGHTPSMAIQTMVSRPSGNADRPPLAPPLALPASTDAAQPTRPRQPRHA